MSSASVIVRYDGPILADHRMDVSDLAPALLGISELCKIANRKFNSERAAMQVLIGADQEQKCFQFKLEIVQTLFQQAQTLLAHQEVRTAKEILEWIGLIGGPVVGLFMLLRKLGNKEIEKTVFEVRDGRDVVIINVKGDNNAIVTHRQSFEMLAEQGVIDHAKKVVQPVVKPGYEEVEFESDKQVVERITKTDAEAITNVSSISRRSGTFVA